jgi:hypothetical protein
MLPRRPGEQTKHDVKDPVTGELKLRIPPPSRRGQLKIGLTRINAFCLAFNRLWCMMLNDRDEITVKHGPGERPTHAAMCHSDIEPALFWADMLVDELEANPGADVLSAVVPIKDERGFTSTAVRNPDTGVTRRLTMHDVMRLPETFGIEDVRAQGITTGAGDTARDFLAINTGLWVCRTDLPWIEEFPGFTYVDGIGRNEAGRWMATMVSEDWYWSEWLALRGRKVMATRKVALAHLGHDGREFRNDRAWGDVAYDFGDPQ